jgi:hypothetical protein
LRSWLLALLALLPACGARNALDAPPPPAAFADAGRSDAGAPVPPPPAPLLCFWSLAIPVPLGVFEAPVVATAAVEAESRVAAVLVTPEAPASTVARFVDESGRLLEERDERRLEGRLFSGRGRYLLAAPEGCTVRALDPALGDDGVAFDLDGDCAIAQTDVGTLDVLRLGAADPRAFAFDGRALEERVVPEVPREDGLFLFDRARGDAIVFGYDDERATLILRSAEMGDSELRFVGSSSPPYSLALDRRNGGVVVLRGPGPGARRFGLQRLARGAFAASLWPPELDVSPAGPVTTNDNELLVPLRDGRVLTLALVDAAAPRFFGPVAGGVVDAMEIVLLPGDSAGGALLRQATPEGSIALTWQPFLCNR